MRIRTKLGFFSGVIVLATVATLATVAFILQKKMIESHMGEVRRAQSEGFVAVCRQAITTDNELFMVNFAKLLMESPGIAYAYYVDGDGRIRVHTDKRFFYKTLAEWSAGRPRGVIEASQPVRVGGVSAGTAVIGFSEAYARGVMEGVLSRTLVRIAGAALAVAFAVLPAALLFAVILTRPVRALAEGSAAVGRGDFKVEVKVKSRDELGDLASRFNDMTRQLAVLDEMKDEFISSVSHDLRSPMSAIEMYTQYMLFEDPDKDKVLPQHRNFLLTIMESATRLSVFVTNILDAAKIKAGRAEYHVQPMDPAVSAENVRGLFGILAEKRNISLTTDAPPGLPRMMADPERFDHVVANLVSNSLKFTPSGGRIVIRVRAADGRVQVAVEDTGKGMSQENLGKLFRRFGQVDVADQRAKRVTGTGLGLFIVKEAVEGMGGTISVASEVGKGTRFTVDLPATNEPVPAAGLPAEAPMAKVLVVDDEPAFTEFAKVLLEGMGHKAVLCLDGARALGLALSERPDVVITDLNMPDLDGLQLIEQFKALPETRLIPIILASSSTNKTDRIEAQRLGAIYSILKPLQAPMLKLLLDQILKAPQAVKATVLAVDDDEAILGLVRPALERAGFRVRTAERADDALLILREGGVDLLLLDIQLPGLSGLELLSLLKKDPATVGLPVILLTSRNEEKTRVEGLKTGADDYITKPFSLAELSARVEALLRRARYGGDPAHVLSAGPFRLEMDSREAFAGGTPVPLTETEFRFLALLVQNPGRVLTVDVLTRRLSSDGREVSSDTVYAHVRNLRKKLGSFRRAVRSVHGMGYKLAATPGARS